MDSAGSSRKDYSVFFGEKEICLRSGCGCMASTQCQQGPKPRCSAAIAAALVELEPGAMRELHCHGAGLMLQELTPLPPAGGRGVLNVNVA